MGHMCLTLKIFIFTTQTFHDSLAAYPLATSNSQTTPSHDAHRIQCNVPHRVTNRSELSPEMQSHSSSVSLQHSDPYLGTNLKSIPSAVSGLTESEGDHSSSISIATSFGGSEGRPSPPISIGTSFSGSMQEGGESPSNEVDSLPNSKGPSASFARELRQEIQRRKSRPPSSHIRTRRPRALAHSTSSRNHECFVDKESRVVLPTLEPQVSRSVQKTSSSIDMGRHEIVGDHITCLATRRRMICNAVELIMLKKRSLDDARNFALLRTRLDEATLALRLNEGKTRGKEGREVLIQGLLNYQCEMVAKLSKENSDLRVNQSSLGPHHTHLEKQIETLHRTLKEATKKLTDECLAEKKLSTRKDHQIILLKGLLKNQCDMVDKLSRDVRTTDLGIRGYKGESERSEKDRAQIEELKRELEESQKKLSDECAITTELGKLREALNRRGSLQDERIRRLSKVLKSHSHLIEENKAKLSEMTILLSGERRVRHQMQEVQEVLSKNYGSIAGEHTVLQLKCTEQLKEIKALRKRGPGDIYPSALQGQNQSDNLGKSVWPTYYPQLHRSVLSSSRFSRPVFVLNLICSLLVQKAKMKKIKSRSKQDR
jgi:hypothetical protein